MFWWQCPWHQFWRQCENAKKLFTISNQQHNIVKQFLIDSKSFSFHNHSINSLPLNLNLPESSLRDQCTMSISHRVYIKLHVQNSLPCASAYYILYQGSVCTVLSHYLNIHRVPTVFSMHASSRGPRWYQIMWKGNQTKLIQICVTRGVWYYLLPLLFIKTKLDSWVWCCASAFQWANFYRSIQQQR